MRRLPEDLAQLRPDRLEGFGMLNKPLAPRPAAPAVEPQPPPVEPLPYLVVGRLGIEGDTISEDPAPVAVDLLDSPDDSHILLVHRSPPPRALVVRLDSGGYFALQGLDIGPFIEIPPIRSRMNRESLKLL